MEGSKRAEKRRGGLSCGFAHFAGFFLGGLLLLGCDFFGLTPLTKLDSQDLFAKTLSYRYPQARGDAPCVQTPKSGPLFGSRLGRAAARRRPPA